MFFRGGGAFHTYPEEIRAEGANHAIGPNTTTVIIQGRLPAQWWCTSRNSDEYTQKKKKRVASNLDAPFGVKSLCTVSRIGSLKEAKWTFLGKGVYLPWKFYCSFPPLLSSHSQHSSNGGLNYLRVGYSYFFKFYNTGSGINIHYRIVNLLSFPFIILLNGSWNSCNSKIASAPV